MTDLQPRPQTSGTVFANLAWYRRTKDLMPIFDPKVHLYEKRLWPSYNKVLVAPALNFNESESESTMARKKND